MIFSLSSVWQFVSTVTISISISTGSAAGHQRVVAPRYCLLLPVGNCLRIVCDCNDSAHYIRRVIQSNVIIPLQCFDLLPSWLTGSSCNRSPISNRVNEMQAWKSRQEKKKNGIKQSSRRLVRLTPPPVPPPRLLSRPLMLCSTALSRPSLRLARSNISRSYEFLVIRR